MERHKLERYCKELADVTTQTSAKCIELGKAGTERVMENYFALFRGIVGRTERTDS